MAEKKGLIAEFKEFISRGNVMDLAVGVIIGGAFNAIVTSLSNDVIMPAIQLLIGTVSGSKFVNPETGEPDFEMMTKVLNVGTIKFGAFIAAIINFLIMAIIIFMIVKAVNKLTDITKKKQEEVPEEPTTKECPFCFSEISVKATKCPHCTSLLEEEKKIKVEKKK
ncbi:MAG: large conductance mechanosensitive channel protein MscL [Acutalibacteraceae bacterium]|nr:large conductance mechanosensitive channel protein MscL [Clostridia bacterium]MEE3449568.1 large conductance mechanosensitive channel protein MscL [Acutalibacteraceae bacterium]